MSGEGVISGARPVLREANNHRHGRWTGLFKLGEESGELVVAAVDLMTAAEDADLPVFVRAFENELADVGAACRHAVEANRLDRDRIDARFDRQRQRLEETADVARRWKGLHSLARRCGALQQLLGKIAAFPHGAEHPDGCGNLAGRLEVAIADLIAAMSAVIVANDLDAGHMQRRGDDKLKLFRTWFPAPDGADEAEAAG